MDLPCHGDPIGNAAKPMTRANEGGTYRRFMRFTASDSGWCPNHLPPVKSTTIGIQTIGMATKIALSLI